MAQNSAMKVIQWIIFGLVAVLTLAWWFTGANFFDLSSIYPVAIGFSIAAILLIQSGIYTYFKRSEYKKINMDDVMTWLLAFSGAAIFTSTLLSIKSLNIGLPTVFTHFLTTINAGIGFFAVIVVFFSAWSLAKKH